MPSKGKCPFTELNFLNKTDNVGDNYDNGVNRENDESKDENVMNQWINGSQFSIHSAPISETYNRNLINCDQKILSSSQLSLPIEGNNYKSLSLDGEICVSSIENKKNVDDGCCDALQNEEIVEKDNDDVVVVVESLVRPCSLIIPSSAGKTLNLTAVANEAQLRQCPILVKDLSCDTADDEDNENHLTISSLTARPLIAKSHELKTKKVAKKVREAERRARIRRFKPPDGGYGWAVVVGAFLVQFWVSGLVKSYGVLFVEVLETFTDTSATVAAWIPAILSTLCLALAPIASALCQKFTCRLVVFLGGLFCAAGLISSYFATSSSHLLFSFGLLSGIGGGLSTTPGVLIVSRYFDKHRALANGICISGTAAGRYLRDITGSYEICFYFMGTCMVLGGIVFMLEPIAVDCKFINSSSSSVPKINLPEQSNSKD
ncbi:hypothetical protein Phum_PHUM130210 [Pediculus humanus corporis]|uniref:Monocarboxylate transporter n=1 Tax=Pediculus humanus subsp. corporis TaxID=121224 RepID=E0VEC2_PEDHC|nr:uncharacterized protein Phum_PHUM130210 [Pediculus humanus corporis]EEB11728.1 hypothetical protein Phum_PHUM130210 [Pediculus humanus corporis]